MSLDLNVVSHIMYLHEGVVNPGDEAKMVRYKQKISDWQCDEVDKEIKIWGFQSSLRKKE